MWNSELVSVVEHGGGVVTPTAYERERVAARESVRSVAEPLEQRKDYLFSHSSLRCGVGSVALAPSFPSGWLGQREVKREGSGRTGINT